MKHVNTHEFSYFIDMSECELYEKALGGCDDGEECQVEKSGPICK